MQETIRKSVLRSDVTIQLDGEITGVTEATWSTSGTVVI